MSESTVIVKNNRDEHLTGAIQVDDFRPAVLTGGDMPSLNATPSSLVRIKNSAGTVIGYVKVFPVA